MLKVKNAVLFSLVVLGMPKTVAQNAKYAGFTNKQIAEHLGLSGGNWLVSFDQKLFCGFVITDTSKNGVETKKYIWSSEASKEHKFDFIHDVEHRTNSSLDIHEIKFSSFQRGDWNVDEGNENAKWQVSGGSGLTYNSHLPNDAESIRRVRNNQVEIKPELLEELFSWSSKETKRAFSLDIVFTSDTEKFEADSSDVAGE